MMRLKIFVTVISIIAVALCGCGQKREINITKSKCYMNYDRDVCGRSVQGRDIHSYVFGSGHQSILYIASIHGTERAGTPLMEKFIEYLSRNAGCELTPNQKVIVVPKINPDGFDAKTRHNANNIDLNRNFSAENRENNPINGLWAFSEPESRAIANLIDIYRPQVILVFHEALNCIDYDGPAKEYAEYLGLHTDIPVKKLGARPGSLGAYAGETLGIKTITVEFPPEVRGKDGEYMWQKYNDLVISALDLTSAQSHIR
ncbi:MAG: DUF2817 domain-containing protein [Sedimentisphaeraceae bacterium JB056]